MILIKYSVSASNDSNKSLCCESNKIPRILWFLTDLIIDSLLVNGKRVNNVDCIAVPGVDDDVLVGVAARDVSVVTSGARGHVPRAPGAVLLMQGSPLVAVQPPQRRQAAVPGPLPHEGHRAHLVRRAHPVRGATHVRRRGALLPGLGVRQ